MSVFPMMIRFRQIFNDPYIFNINKVVTDELLKYAHTSQTINMKGKKIGITVGSRGINNIASIIRSISEYINKLGATVYLIPSMGSHGGGNINGQLEILGSLGITEKSTGSKVIRNIDSLLLGYSQLGIPVFVNKNVLDLDGIVVVNRVKPHTDFEGSIESGICKMLAIGLGGPKGAYTVHSYALHKGYEQTIKDVAKTVIDNCNIIFMVGLVENRNSQLAKVQLINPKNIFTEEPKLLALAKKMHAKLPVDKLDLLIIDEIGKNISGTGMDTKIVGRIMIIGQKEPEKPSISRIVVLDITDESHGNAIGLGLADIITRKVFNKIDLKSTALNSISSMSPEQGRIPVVLENDKNAINAALESLGSIKDKEFRILHIRNTLFMEEMEASINLLEELSSKDSIHIIGKAHPLNFSSKGFLSRI
jgi:hypothetical protein